jgi:hypothetical protein
MNKLIDITVIFDASGSMEDLKEHYIKCLNNFINEQKSLNPLSVFSLYFFNSIPKLNITTVNNNTLLKNVKLLTENDYKPDGMTPLYKSVYKILEDKKSSNEYDKIVLIITDGMDNDSDIYKPNTVAEKIKSLKEKGWKIIYMGTNQDAFLTGNSLSIDYSINFSEISITLPEISRAISYPGMKSHEALRTMSENSKDLISQNSIGGPVLPTRTLSEYVDWP